MNWPKAIFAVLILQLSMFSYVDAELGDCCDAGTDTHIADQGEDEHDTEDTCGVFSSCACCAISINKVFVIPELDHSHTSNKGSFQSRFYFPPDAPGIWQPPKIDL